MSKADALVRDDRLHVFSLRELAKQIWDFLPSGGSLPADVWQSRHRFLLGLTWLHALLIAFIGPILGYSWELSVDALLRDGTVLHTVGEGFIVALFGAVAKWGTRHRALQATAVGFGLMSASAILVHLSGGYIEFHFHFFVMVVTLALYQDWIPYLLAIAFVAVHHGTVGTFFPEDVYNHPAALQGPWLWAGIHAFFILCIAVASAIAWRFNERASAEVKLILDSAGEGIYGLDRHGKITFMNPAAELLLRVEGQDVVGKAMEFVLRHTRADGSGFSDDDSPVLAPLRDAARRRATNELFWRKDGTSFFADYESTPIVERGKLKGAVVTFRDVSERREAEERKRQYVELQTLHEIGQTILSSLDLQVMADSILDGAHRVGAFDIGMIRLLDRAGETLEPVASRGYRDPENIHRQRKRLSDPSTGRVMAQILATKETEVEDLSQMEGMSAFKQEGVRTLISVPLCTHDEVLGIIHLGSRTARKFGDSEIRILNAIGGQAAIAIQKARLYEDSRAAQAAVAQKAEELARSNTELQHFAYVSSHDLQEPLRMVGSYVQLLARRYKGKLDADADEYIGFAVDGAKRMQDLINDLLAYSRIGTKGKAFEPTECDSVLQTTLKNLQIAIQDSAATIQHEPLPSVMGDAIQLGQLFQNLIGNSIKFRSDKAPVIQVAAERNGGEWLFSFRDDGIGIDPQFSERIFIIFQRLHSKAEYPGTGIGLALCKKIVERHGGRIWVDSESGKGATFHFTIPA